MERERLCQTRFPEAVREWFSLEDVDSIFHEKTYGDRLPALLELGDPAEVSQGYLKVATENQAVVGWYIRLSEGDDPPVYNNQDHWEEDLSTVPWEFEACTFTNFIFDMVSRGHFQGWYEGRCLSARDPFPEEEDLRYLRLYFREGPRTDTPEARVLRFFSTAARIVIRAAPGEDAASVTAEWELEASSSVELYRMAKIVWSIGTLAKTLKPDGNEQERAQTVLDRIRSE